ncbi:hypothetical protein V6U90_02895 [Micromonospora sp. CPCC 206060]|uniref:hypothetical protein n=1 Tax=Micromonospora sp. CPCC 206060 TaxID=3122406 RepID=UPI002FF208D2
MIGLDRYRLRVALRSAGVPMAAFCLAEVHEPGPAPTDYWFLRRTPDGQRWEIGSYERGVHDVRGVFDTEPAACAALYQALTGRPAPPG